MAKLYISEFANMRNIDGRVCPVAEAPALVVQTPVTISGTSAQSDAFSAQTKFIRVHADVIASIAFGENPTATTDDDRLVAGQTEYFGVYPGMKVAVISNT